MPSEQDPRGLSATTHMALAGGGEMGALIRAFDWSATALGPVSSWPRSLLTCVRLILTSRQPMFVWWGEQLLNLYNDAYRSIVGGKHPQALGQPASVVWREIWEQIGPRTDVSLRGNEGTYDEALLLIMNRNGYDEETYYTFSYSPVPDDEGGVGGIFCANTDDTARIVGERQLGLLRELASRAVDARSPDEACALAAGSFASNQRDLLFALVYLADGERQGLHLAGSAGIAPGHAAAPAFVSPGGGAPWPFERVLQGEPRVLVSDLGERFEGLPTGAWARPPQSAVMLPIMSAGSGGVAGVLVVGLNPFRRWDDGYQGFLSLVVGQMEAAISNAQAYAEERRRAEALAAVEGTDAVALSALRRENLQLLERERAARRQAEAESRLRDEFLATVSHELRTPLQAILGWSRMLVQLPPEPARLAKGLEIIERNSRAQAQIIDDILEVSAIVRGKVRLSPRPVEVRRLVETAIETLRVASDARRISVVSAVDDDVGQIVADADRLAQVIWNLLSNSLKYGRSGGRVEVRARRAAEHVEITIQDDGQGIRPEFLPYVFERFRQGDQATTRSYSGLGLGLSIVRHLIELHGGAVQAFSEGEGKGATFTVRLPVSLDPADERPAPRASAPSIEEAPGGQPAALAGARVLVVDDEADIRDILAAVLAEAGARVQVASSVREALGLLRTAPFDALISDIGMPSEDGYGLVRQLRGLPAPAGALPALALTAYARPDDRRLALEAGFQAHLAKPVDPARLLAAVGELLAAQAS